MTNKENELYDGTLDQIADAVHQNAVAHGFHPKDQSVADFLNYQLMNLIEEISELHSSWRHGKFNEPCDKTHMLINVGLPVLTCAEEEYADIVIRALDQCRRLKINISRAVAIKHMLNITRPYRHGDKLS